MIDRQRETDRIWMEGWTNEQTDGQVDGYVHRWMKKEGEQIDKIPIVESR